MQDVTGSGRRGWISGDGPQSTVSCVFRSLGNGVRKNGVRNRCPYRRCGVDTEIPYRLPFGRKFCLFLPVRVAPGVDTEFPYRVRIVDRGVDCRDPVCRHRFRFLEFVSGKSSVYSENLPFLAVSCVLKKKNSKSEHLRFSVEICFLGLPACALRPVPLISLTLRKIVTSIHLGGGEEHSNDVHQKERCCMLHAFSD